MFKSSYKIATVWGIPIKTNISLLVIIIYLAFSMAQPEHPSSIFIGLFVGLALFVSIALHELGHSYVAIKKGCRVRGITLAIFGGVASMERIPTKPKDEFQMAIAGPLVSLSLGIAGIGASILLDHSETTIAQMFSVFFLHMGAINLMLTFFNIIPAFPMDGGRILRAILTPKRGKLKATYIASRIGRALALLFGFWGLSQFFQGHQTFGLMKVIVATFIYTGAENEYNMVKREDAAQWFGHNNSQQPDEPFRDDENDELAEVSPPPYEEGPVTKVQIINTKEDIHFTNTFKR